MHPVVGPSGVCGDCTCAACTSTGTCTTDTSAATLATEATSDARSGCRCDSSPRLPRDGVIATPIEVSLLSVALAVPLYIHLAPGRTDRVGQFFGLYSCMRQSASGALGDLLSVGISDGDVIFHFIFFLFPGLSAPCLILQAIYYHCYILSTAKCIIFYDFCKRRNTMHLRRR